MDDPDVKLLLLIVLGAALGGAAWYFRDEIFSLVDEPAVVRIEPATEETPAPTGPIHPISLSDSTDSADVELVQLPPLGDSDGYFLLALIDSFGPEIGNALVTEALIDKFVATVDNLTRSHVAEKLRPVRRLAGTFEVDTTDDNGPYYLSRDNYQRYDVLVNLITRADLDTVAATYRRFYPLFQESYEHLGYPNAYFNDRVVDVIDHLLQTPEPDEPIELVRPNVLYEFADAKLQARSSGQKLLLRMGNEHAARIKQVLRELRSRIAQSPG